MIERPILELRMRRAWRIAVAIAIPAFTALIVAGSASILSSARDPVGGIVGVAIIAVTLGGLIVIPGIAVLSRLARGAPDVRIDAQGVVWGNDRSRDLAIDWSEVESVTSRIQKSRYLTDRLLVLEPRAGRIGTPPRTLYGRLMALSNRVTSGSRFAISTMVVD
ncbi:MAG TPA: hypothetical protein VFK35_09000, partial [Candidatus Limnocylindrales bacterium]|nr:hypothetical protein [Candidatus Limnocylindrales bacterium]